MNFNEIIYSRCSARLFTDDEVSKEQLQAILCSGSIAPSAKNRQPWKFYILNDKQKSNLYDIITLSNGKYRKMGEKNL